MIQETRQNVRCAIYTRKSTEEGLQQDFNTLDAQRESAEAYIVSQKSQGWVALPQRYDDGGFSGGNVERPAFKQLMDDVEAGKVDCIVVYKIDRLSRSLMDFAKIMESLEKYDVSVVSVTQQFNTHSSMGRLTLNILLSFAQFEREIISERTRDKIAASRRKGKWTGGKPVLGYDILSTPGGSKLKVNKKEAKQLREIFELYVELQSVRDTILACRERGWTTKRFETKRGQKRGGKDYSKSTMHKMLSNPLYLGKITYKDEIYEGEHEAIIDADLFGKVQGMLKLNQGTGGTRLPSRNKYQALLKGLVFCKHCDCLMIHHYAMKGNKCYRYYVCQNAHKHGYDKCVSPSLPAVELEEFVINEIKAIGKDNDLIEENIKLVQAHLQDEVDGLLEERKLVEAEVLRISRQVGELAPRAGYDPEASAEMELRQNQIVTRQKRIEKLNERMISLEKRMISKDELTGAMESFKPMWEKMTGEEKMKLIQLLVDHVIYDGKEESLSVTFHPTDIDSLNPMETTT